MVKVIVDRKVTTLVTRTYDIKSTSVGWIKMRYKVASEHPL